MAKEVMLHKFNTTVRYSKTQGTVARCVPYTPVKALAAP